MGTTRSLPPPLPSARPGRGLPCPRDPVRVVLRLGPQPAGAAPRPAAAGPGRCSAADRPGEGQTTELKETTGQIKPAIETLAAFASQPEGGWVVFGANDDGTPNRRFVLGVDTQEKVARATRANTLSMTTGEPFLPALYAFRDPDLLVAVAAPGADRNGPYLAYGKRWRRFGATTNKVDVDYRQLARVYQDTLLDWDLDDPLPYRFCEQCGGQRLDRRDLRDGRSDRVYYTVRCVDCGWGTATE